MIRQAAVFSAQGEQLARWSTGQQVDFAAQLREVEVADVALVQGPACDGIDTTALILADAGATVPVPFDDGSVGEPRFGYAERKTSGTREQLDRPHGRVSPRKGWIREANTSVLRNSHSHTIM